MFLSGIGGIIFIASGGLIDEKLVKERALQEGVSKKRVRVISDSKWDDFVKNLVDGVEIDETTERLSEFKTCSYCGKQVHAASKVGERCPHCGHIWLSSEYIEY